MRMGRVRASPAGGVLDSRPASASKVLLFLYKFPVIIIGPQKELFSKVNKGAAQRYRCGSHRTCYPLTCGYPFCTHTPTH